MVLSKLRNHFQALSKSERYFQIGLICVLILAAFTIINIFGLGFIYDRLPDFVKKKVLIEKISSCEKRIEDYESEILKNEIWIDDFTRISSYRESLSLELRNHREKQSALYKKIADEKKEIKKLKLKLKSLERN